jgi:hypothetical protein
VNLIIDERKGRVLDPASSARGCEPPGIGTIDVAIEVTGPALLYARPSLKRRPEVVSKSKEPSGVGPRAHSIRRRAVRRRNRGKVPDSDDLHPVNLDVARSGQLCFTNHVRDGLRPPGRILRQSYQEAARR